MTRHLAILTVGRSDYGRYRSVLRALAARCDVRFSLLAGGGHFDPRFGGTVAEIRADGFDVIDCIGDMRTSGNGGDVARIVARQTAAIGDFVAVERPDLMVVLGDRYEMISGPLAALGFNLPVAHIHGGAVTEGAIDDMVRHAMTKMSHLHLVSCARYGERVRQMGEEPWRIHVTGAPGLDELSALASGPESVFAELDLAPSAPIALVTYHPVTVGGGDPRAGIRALLNVLADLEHRIVLTYPNADPGYLEIIDEIEAFHAAHAARARIARNLGTARYVKLMAVADFMIGNSSSAVVEAPNFRLPAVNIGNRQEGKVKGANVIDCDGDEASIRRAVGKATDPAFRASLRGTVSPYGDGKSGPRIAEILSTVALDDRLLAKKFADL